MEIDAEEYEFFAMECAEYGKVTPPDGPCWKLVGFSGGRLLWARELSEVSSREEREANEKEQAERDEACAERARSFLERLPEGLSGEERILALYNIVTGGDHLRKLFFKDGGCCRDSYGGYPVISSVDYWARELQAVSYEFDRKGTALFQEFSRSRDDLDEMSIGRVILEDGGRAALCCTTVRWHIGVPDGTDRNSFTLSFAIPILRIEK